MLQTTNIKCTHTHPGSDRASVLRSRRLTLAISWPFVFVAKYDSPECYKRWYIHLTLAINGPFCRTSFVIIKCFSYLGETQACITRRSTRLKKLHEKCQVRPKSEVKILASYTLPYTDFAIFVGHFL